MIEGGTSESYLESDMTFVSRLFEGFRRRRYRRRALEDLHAKDRVEAEIELDALMWLHRNENGELTLRRWDTNACRVLESSELPVFLTSLAQAESQACLILDETLLQVPAVMEAIERANIRTQHVRRHPCELSRIPICFWIPQGP